MRRSKEAKQWQVVVWFTVEAHSAEEAEAIVQEWLLDVEQPPAMEARGEIDSRSTQQDI